MTQTLLKCGAFSAAEDAVVRRHFPRGGAAACAPRLPGRSAMQIQNRASRLRVFRNKKPQPRTVVQVARKPRRARLVELVRQAPAGQSGGNWWRATIAPPSGSNLVHYSQGPKAKATVAAKRIIKRMNALQSGPEWRAFSINGSAEAFRNGDDFLPL